MENKKRFVSVTAGIVACAMVMGLLFNILPQVQAASSSEIKQQIEALEKEQDALEVKIQELESQRQENLSQMSAIIEEKNIIDQQIGLLHEQISSKNAQISAYAVLIADKQKELDEAEARYINKKMNTRDVEAGLQTLNGRQALWYARNRSSGPTSDFGRTNRQRTVLNALIQAYKEKPLTEMIGLLDDILPLITTDLTQGEILSYVSALFPMLSECEIVTQHIPVQGGYYDATIRGMQVLVPNMEVNRQALIDSLTNGETAE